MKPSAAAGDEMRDRSGALDGSTGASVRLLCICEFGTRFSRIISTARKPRRPISYQNKSRESSGLQIVFRPEIVLPNVQGEWRRMR